MKNILYLTEFATGLFFMKYCRLFSLNVSPAMIPMFNVLYVTFFTESVKKLLKINK